MSLDISRLDNYKSSLRTAWGYNDYIDWPIKINSITHLFLPELAREFLLDLETISDAGITDQALGSAFGNPARVYRLINPLIFGMKRLKVDIAMQRSIVIRLLDIVKCMKYGSEYNEDSCNIILSPNQVADIVSEHDYKKITLEQAKMLQRFCGIIWAYTESIFFRAHDVTKEIHGPYALGNGEQLLVREYLNLSPKEIWGDLPFIPHSKIVLYARYTDQLDLAIDPYNHLFLHEGNYINDLIDFWIEIDDLQVSLDDLWKVLPSLQQTMRNIHQWVSQASAHDLIHRYADIFWYRKKPLAELSGRNWQVPQEVRERINQGEPDLKRQSNLTADEIERLIHFLI